MADEKLYEFGSDEELERYLEGLSDEDRDTFLREYATKASEASDEDLKKAALEDEEASPAEIERYESTISEIEAGNTNKFNTNPQSSRQALEKTLNRSLRSSSSDRRWHTMRLAVINNGAGFYNAYNGGAATIKFTVPICGNTQNGCAGNWDQIVQVDDVSAGAPFPNTVSWSGSNFFNLSFPVTDYTANTIVQKDIQITWSSGFVKTFTLYVGLNDMGYGVFPAPFANAIGTSGSTGIFMGDCSGYADPFQQYGRTSHLRFNALGTPSDEFSMYVLAEAVDSNGYWGTGEWLATRYTTTQQSYSFHPHQSIPHLSPENRQWGPNANDPGPQTVRYYVKHFATGKGFPTPTWGTIADATDLMTNNLNASDWDNYTGGTQGAFQNWDDTWSNNTGSSIIHSSGSSFRAYEAGLGNRMGFSTEIQYAENLTNCSTIVISNSYDVCLDPLSASYYENTCLDCNGAQIPAQECNGTIAATFNDGQCCPVPCTLETSINTINASFGTADGIIYWDAADPSGSANPSGTPFGSGHMYTVTVTASTAASITTQAGAGGTSFTVSGTTNTTSGTEHLIAVSSNSQIAPGMLVTGTGIPAGAYVSALMQTGTWNTNITQFAIVDAAGAPLAATVAATNTLTFTVGYAGAFGGLLPNTVNGLGAGTFYEICIKDDDDCEECSIVIINENQASQGCTDNTALNYDATAIVDDGSCILCNAQGQLEDPGTNYTGDLYTGTVTTSDATVNASCVLQSDGNIGAAVSMNNTAAFYLETDGSQSYTFTLYPLGVQGDITSAGAATATQTGLAVTTYGGNPSHTFTNVAYGHYAIKVQLVDNDETHGLEPCFSYFFGTIKAAVCDDPTATNYNTSIPADLRYPANQCCTYPSVCCMLGAIQKDTSIRGTDCNPFLYSTIICDPPATNVSGYWTLNGVQIPGSAFNLGAVSGTTATMWLMDASQSSLFTANGTYEVHYTATYNSQADCNDSIQGTFNLPVCDCDDPTALNYNPNTTIPNNALCIYPSWNCINGNCVDPGDGTGTYNDITVCQSNCTPIIYGCTDTCATNYNAAATIDDGSCLYRVCDNPNASNHMYSCDCNQVIPNATQSDPNCCIFPCLPSNTLVVNTLNSSGSCTTPVADGSATAQFIINSNATTWTWAIYDNSQTTLIYQDSTTYTGSVTSAAYSSLVPGVYWAIVTDNLGCTWDVQFTVGTTSLTQGCTDPTADNYDPNAQCDDGSCVYCGCTDPLANNYNPNAACDDGSCDYTIPQNNCIPPNIDKRIKEINLCLSEKGSIWLHKYKIGTADNCTLMNKWKLILIQYLLDQKGLTCLYNCADEDSPDLNSINSTCTTLALNGGPATGLNDQGFAGSTYSASTGTVITNPALYFVQANTLNQGDVITMPSGLVWEMTMPGNCTWGCYNPETNQGQQSGHWTQCVEVNNITITDNTNYIDNFLNFANKYCRDCNISILGEGNYQVA